MHWMHGYNNVYDFWGWGIDDFIYMKCTGTKDEYKNPTGWLKINDVVYTYYIIGGGGNNCSLNYDEDSPRVKLKDCFWQGSFKLVSGNRVKLNIKNDYLNSSNEGKTFYLDPIVSNS